MNNVSSVPNFYTAHFIFTLIYYFKPIFQFYYYITLIFMYLCKFFIKLYVRLNLNLTGYNLETSYTMGNNPVLVTTQAMVSQ